MQPLAPQVRTVWRIKLLLFWGWLLLMAFGYEIFQFFRGVDRLLPFSVLTLGVLTLAVLMIGLVPSLRYRFWRYDLRAEELYLERGIWNRVRTIVPLRRIQHLDVSQDLLEREYDLGKLIVHTAGTRGSSVVLPGLALPDAERLRDTMKHYITDDAV